MAKLAADLKFARCLPPVLGQHCPCPHGRSWAVERCLAEPIVTWTG